MKKLSKALIHIGIAGFVSVLRPSGFKAQSRTLLSAAPLANIVPSGDMARLRTQEVWPM